RIDDPHTVATVAGGRRTPHAAVENVGAQDSASHEKNRGATRLKRDDLQHVVSPFQDRTPPSDSRPHDESPQRISPAKSLPKMACMLNTFHQSQLPTAAPALTLPLPVGEGWRFAHMRRRGRNHSPLPPPGEAG